MKTTNTYDIVADAKSAVRAALPFGGVAGVLWTDIADAKAVVVVQHSGHWTLRLLDADPAGIVDLTIRDGVVDAAFAAW